MYEKKVLLTAQKGVKFGPVWLHTLFIARNHRQRPLVHGVWCGISRVHTTPLGGVQLQGNHELPSTPLTLWFCLCGKPRVALILSASNRKYKYRVFLQWFPQYLCKAPWEYFGISRSTINHEKKLRTCYCVTAHYWHESPVKFWKSNFSSQALENSPSRESYGES